MSGQAARVELPVDGRQSARAMAVRRGAQRMLRARRNGLGYSSLPEITLASGRRADLVACGPDGTIAIIEIKSSVEDFRADRKWRDYLLFCDRFYFATLPDVPEATFPVESGLIVADSFGAAVIRDAAEHGRLPASTRKALLVRLGRIAADRLLALADPDSISGLVEF